MDPSPTKKAAYRFDNRLLNQEVIVDHKNYRYDMLVFNGIYYQVNRKITYGDHIKITKIKGNILFVDILPSQKKAEN